MHYRTTVYGNKISKSERVRIFVEVPHPESLAGLIKLKHFYSSIDERRKEALAPYKVWLRFRNKWLRRQKKKFGTLTCYLCKTTNLNANINSPRLNSHNQMATIDHFIPTSKSGRKFDEKNLRICCMICNQKKSDQLPSLENVPVESATVSSVA